MVSAGRPSDGAAHIGLYGTQLAPETSFTSGRRKERLELDFGFKSRSQHARLTEKAALSPADIVGLPDDQVLVQLQRRYRLLAQRLWPVDALATLPRPPRWRFARLPSAALPWQPAPTGSGPANNRCPKRRRCGDTICRDRCVCFPVMAVGALRYRQLNPPQYFGRAGAATACGNRGCGTGCRESGGSGNPFGRLYGRLYRHFGIAGYKVPATRFEALAWIGGDRDGRMEIGRTGQEQEAEWRRGVGRGEGRGENSGQEAGRMKWWLLISRLWSVRRFCCYCCRLPPRRRPGHDAGRHGDCRWYAADGKTYSTCDGDTGADADTPADLTDLHATTGDAGPDSQSRLVCHLCGQRRTGRLGEPGFRWQSVDQLAYGVVGQCATPSASAHPRFSVPRTAHRPTRLHAQQTDANGRVARFHPRFQQRRFFWATAATGFLPDTTRPFPISVWPATARYMRLTATSEVNGGPWTAVGELTIVRERGGWCDADNGTDTDDAADGDRSAD